MAAESNGRKPSAIEQDKVGRVNSRERTSNQTRSDAFSRSERRQVRWAFTPVEQYRARFLVCRFSSLTLTSTPDRPQSFFVSLFPISSPAAPTNPIQYRLGNMREGG